VFIRGGEVGNLEKKSLKIALLIIKRGKREGVPSLLEGIDLP